MCFAEGTIPFALQISLHSFSVNVIDSTNASNVAALVFDDIHRKMDLVLEYIEEQRKKNETYEDLVKDELVPGFLK